MKKSVGRMSEKLEMTNNHFVKMFIGILVLWMRGLVVSKAYSEPSQTSKMELFPTIANSFHNTQRERLVFHSIQYRNGWLAASDLFHMFTQSIKFYTFHYQYRCLKNAIHQMDSKNGWLFLSASFTAKFGLVFILTLGNAFS